MFKKTKKGLAVAAAAVLGAALVCGALAGCSSQKSEQQGAQSAAASLEGKSLNIYCGAGMTNPFQ